MWCKTRKVAKNEITSEVCFLLPSFFIQKKIYNDNTRAPVSIMAHKNLNSFLMRFNGNFKKMIRF